MKLPRAFIHHFNSLDESNVNSLNIDIIYISFYRSLKLGSSIDIVVLKRKKPYPFSHKWHLTPWKSLGTIDYKHHEHVKLYNIKFFTSGGRKYYKRLVCDDLGHLLRYVTILHTWHFPFIIIKTWIEKFHFVQHPLAIDFIHLCSVMHT